MNNFKNAFIQYGLDNGHIKPITINAGDIIKGKKSELEKIIPNKSEKVVIDVTSFTKDLYFVRISSDKMYMTKKLLIQR